MATAIPPDIGMAVGRYLRDHAAVRALVGTQVVSRTPRATTAPWVAVKQIGGNGAVGSSRALRLGGWLLDFHCYADSANDQAQASRIARTVMAALCDLRGTVGEAVISGVPPSAMSQPLHSPDSDVSNPARERYIVTATIYARS